MHYRIKKRWSLLAVAFILLFVGLIYWLCIYDADSKGYIKVKERAKAQTQHNEAPHQAFQKKTQISKQFWRTNNGQRLFSRLNAKEGSLIYEKERSAQKFIEEMSDVDGVFQKSIALSGGNQKKQEVYTLKAKQARYDHLQECLIAEDLLLYLYQIEGDIPPNQFDPNLAHMVFSGKKGKLQGDKIYLEGTVAIKSPNEWSLLCEELSYEDSKIFLQGEVFLEIFKKRTNIFSEKALIQMSKENTNKLPENIILDGDVRLTRREGKLLQYLLADHAIYDLLKKNAHFQSHRPHRVLLHDKINNLEVSAPEIVMYRDEAKKMQFKGIGDVKFRFAEEEYERMKTRFLFERDSSHGS